MGVRGRATGSGRARAHRLGRGRPVSNRVWDRAVLVGSLLGGGRLGAGDRSGVGVAIGGLR